VAGTIVLTTIGEVSIENLTIGDIVYSVHAGAPGSEAQQCQVTETFERIAPFILRIACDNGSTIGLTPEHDIWTVQAGWTTAGNLRPGDHLACANGGFTAIEHITIDTTPTVVYNIAIDGSFTYYADGVWVHNCNSCKVGRQLLFHLHHILPKFLEGANSARALIPEHLHRLYHSGLMKHLSANGIRRESKRQSWTDYFQGDDELLKKAHLALLAFTRKCDAEQGTTLTRLLEKELGL
jgi:hypothetical protein